MLHEFTIEGNAFRLRPLVKSDSNFVVALRTASINREFINSTSSSIVGQHRWFEDYSFRTGDYYFIIERKDSREAEGSVALYDAKPDSAEWGRWILQRSSTAAIESALLLYRFAFDILEISEIYCRTVENNSQVISFHESCGLKRTSGFHLEVMVNGYRQHLIEHRLSTDQWPLVKTTLTRLSNRLSRHLHSPSLDTQ